MANMPEYDKYKKGNFLSLEIEDHIATITMDQDAPSRGEGDWVELLSAFNHDPDVRAVLLQGASDRYFNTGANVKNMAASEAREGSARAAAPGSLLSGSKWMLHAFLNLKAPSVACINGDAVGVGATIALMCDVTVMADTARIADTHARNVGLAAGDGGALIWPMLVGISKAKELLMTGRLVHAQEAKEIGLVNRVVPKDQVRQEARALAEELAGRAPLAIQFTKMALNQQIWRQMVDVQHLALALEDITMRTEDSKEAAAAWVQKRPGTFAGR